MAIIPITNNRTQIDGSHPIDPYTYPWSTARRNIHGEWYMVGNRVRGVEERYQPTPPVGGSLWWDTEHTRWTPDQIPAATPATPIDPPVDPPTPGVLSLPVVQDINLSPAQFHYPRRVVLVGAGGTGARLAQLLPRILNPGDLIEVWDGDRVEERNLYRQHFIQSDVGKNKAEVVAARLKLALPTLSVQFSPEMFTGTIMSVAARTDGPIIFLGCVDTPQARQTIYTAYRRSTSIYLDAGNSLRTGQVILSTCNLSVNAPTSLIPHCPVSGASTTRSVMRMTYHGLQIHAPELLVVRDDADEPCGVRFDTQSVAANAMAATIMGSMLAALCDGLPFTTPMVQFCTNPVMTMGTSFTPSPHPVSFYHNHGQTYTPLLV